MVLVSVKWSGKQLLSSQSKGHPYKRLFLSTSRLAFIIATGNFFSCFEERTISVCIHVHATFSNLKKKIENFIFSQTKLEELFFVEETLHFLRVALGSIYKRIVYPCIRVFPMVCLGNNFLTREVKPRLHIHIALGSMSGSILTVRQVVCPPPPPPPPPPPQPPVLTYHLHNVKWATQH